MAEDFEKVVFKKPRPDESPAEDFFFVYAIIAFMNVREKKAIISAAKAGGRVVRKYFGRVLTIEEKSTTADFRTQADVGSEKAIIKILKKAFPKYNILSEECGMINRGSEYTFYVDPLDGTNNFVLGIPNFSVLISLAKGREAIFGIVYIPMLDIYYYAEKGSGVFCGIKHNLKLSSETSLARATVGYGCAYKTAKTEVARIIGNLIIGGVKRTLADWAPAIEFCQLVSGKIESMININTELYDFLGAKLIMREAGCVITDFKGNLDTDDFNPTFLASNNWEIHNKILPLL